MPSYANSTPEQLRKRLHEVERELENMQPALYQEMQLLRRLLAAAEENRGMFDGIRGVIDAIELCLQTTGDFMSRHDIYEMLSRRGFPLKAETGKYLVNDSIYYHLNKSGRLIERGDKVGLKAWAHGKVSRKS